jgi:hypothetical protein
MKLYDPKRARQAGHCNGLNIADTHAESSAKEMNRLSKLANKKRGCPDCGGGLRHGPEGGCGMNVRCEGCGHEFTIAWLGDRVAMVSRLDRDDTSIYSQNTLEWPPIRPKNRLLHSILVFLVEVVPWKPLLWIGIIIFVLWLFGQVMQSQHRRNQELEARENARLQQIYSQGQADGIRAVQSALELQGTTMVLRVEKLIEAMTNKPTFK